MTTYPHSPDRFRALARAGGRIDAYRATIRVPRVQRHGGRHVLLIPGSPPLILYASTHRSVVDWIDFAIELVAGLAALMTGFTLGREGYEALKPIIDHLYHTDERFRALVQEVGQRALKGDPLSVGKAVRTLWLYLWRHHRRTIFRGILRAIGRSLRPARLLLMLLRWVVRLLSAGAALLMEIGLLVMPLNRKLRGR